MKALSSNFLLFSFFFVVEVSIQLELEVRRAPLNKTEAIKGGIGYGSSDEEG